MKTKNFKTFFMLSIITLLQSCSSVHQYLMDNYETKSKNKVTKIHKYDVKKLKLSNFDQVLIDNNQAAIDEMIRLVQPELDASTRARYALDIHKALKKFPVNPQIMISLIDTESDFQYTKISETGDLSIAQINPDVWNKEFKMLKKDQLSSELLQSPDQSYAMMKMAKILTIIQKRHAKKDRRWYARYHSNTPKLKYTYLAKIDERMRILEKSHPFIMKRSLATN